MKLLVTVFNSLQECIDDGCYKGNDYTFEDTDETIHGFIKTAIEHDKCVQISKHVNCAEVENG